MPKNAIDYSKTIIYKLCCNDVNIKEVYVGHTTDIASRKRHHKDSCIYEKNKAYHQYKYQFIRDNGGFENWSLVPIEEFSCENVNQALMRERYWIEVLQASLNKNIPSRPKCEYGKIYREQNRNKIKIQKQQYREENKEKFSQKRKEHYENNKDIYSQNSKEYYEKNKDKLNQKVECECGGSYTKANKAHHFKTLKHTNYMSSLT